MVRFRFHQYAWGLLAYNVAVILGGAFVRATVSGDGCGSHWPDCHGQLFPQGGRLATYIEFSHRASTGILLPLVLALVVWAFRAFRKGHPARPASVYVLLFTLIEAAIGAGLVLFRLVAHDRSVERAVAMPAHLVTTFLLLMALALVAWWGQAGEGENEHPTRRLQLRGQGSMPAALAFAMFSLMALGVSGAITALGDTLFPARSLAEGLQQDFEPAAHFLLSLRIYHPLIAMSAGLFLVLIAALAMQLRPSEETRRYGRWTIGLFLAQMGAGALNLLLLAPVWMQLVHLLLADLLWVNLVLLSAAALTQGVPQVELNSVGAPALAAPGSATWRDYVALTKPRVISLLLFTTLMAMPIAGGAGWLTYLCVAVGFYMAAGAANAINMVLERDLDLAMGRTARRPTVTERIPPRDALQFALTFTVGSFGILWWGANLLTAMLALAGLAFYVIVYTLLLKRRTWANIVIGGAAGAFPPLVGWAAATGDLSPLAWCLFGIIFLWTPVHFWALALMIKDDYARAGVPMLPVVRGERATVTQIAGYAVLTALISIAPMLLHGAQGQSVVGWFYVGVAVALNAVLLLRSLQLYRQPDQTRARSLFKYSMVYLALLFLAMAVDQAPWI